jgi:hypothetical protein
MAATADDVRRMRLTFTPGAAIVAVLLGQTMTTGMSALFALIHGYLCQLDSKSANLFQAVSN